MRRRSETTTQDVQSCYSQHDRGIHPGVDGCKPPIIIL